MVVKNTIEKKGAVDITTRSNEFTTEQKEILYELHAIDFAISELCGRLKQINELIEPGGELHETQQKAQASMQLWFDLLNAAKNYLKSMAENDRVELDCRKALDVAFMCTTPGNQMTTFYRTGELDNCRQSWGDLVRCCRAKMMEPSDAKVYLQGSKLAENYTPYETDVWEKKEKSGW